MKYIRTKDGVWQLENTYEHLGKTYYNVKERISTYSEEEIIKQADTIEELCDEVVIVDKNDKYHLVVKDKRSLSIIAQNENVYGAIWTDKGLIYVAKTNEKGELELL